MKIMVTGANGFIASALIESLLLAKHEVIACARDASNLPNHSKLQFQEMDFLNMPPVPVLASYLKDVDVIVNCAGILREKHAGEFHQVHVVAPTVLLAAAEKVGVKKFIQLSAIGDVQDGDFIKSKTTFDGWLQKSTLTHVVIKPSVVMSLHGSYGGTSLLRALASMPYVLFIPGRGRQQLQPILLADLTAMFMAVTDGSGTRLRGKGWLFAPFAGKSDPGIIRPGAEWHIV